MPLIDKVGTYLGYATSHGVDTSSGGHPQLILQCEATHYYDEDVEDYVEVADNPELRAYSVLYGKAQKPLRNCEQVKKVFGWDGLSFQALAEMDISEIRFLFRVEENTYQDNTTLQISWIDVDTASPTRQISSLDTKDLQDLDAKYGLAKVAKKGGPKKPKTAKPKPPTVAKPKSPTTAKPKAEKAKATKPVKPAPKAPAPAPKATEPVVEETEPEGTPGSTTRDDAWKYISEQIPDAAFGNEPDDARALAWTKAIEKIHGGPDDDTLTGEEWFKVQDEIEENHIPF